MSLAGSLLELIENPKEHASFIIMDGGSQQEVSRGKRRVCSIMIRWTVRKLSEAVHYQWTPIYLTG
jgi:hypothetical protein